MKATKGCECAECPIKNGCFLICNQSQTDVLVAPCGKAIGYTTDRRGSTGDGSPGFWSAEMESWMKVAGTTVTPRGIQAIFFDEGDPAPDYIIIGAYEREGSE